MADGPLWIPWALRRPVPNPGHHDPTIHTIGSVFHVAVSWSDSLQDYFTHSSGGVESTGYIRTDGTLEQYRDLVTECDAQWEGNSWFHDGTRYGFNSWESEGDCTTEWTPAQLHTIKRIIRWQHDEYGVALRRNPGPFYSGFGYHCLFDEWNHSGHSCPCPSRVKQFNNIIVPWMERGAPLDEEDDVSLTKADIRRLLNTDAIPNKGPLRSKNSTVQVDNAIADAREWARLAKDRVGSIAIPGNSVLAGRTKRRRCGLREALSNVWWAAEQSRRNSSETHAKQIAAAVVAALPPASKGGLTTDDIEAAVKQALREGTS